MQFGQLRAEDLAMSDVVKKVSENNYQVLDEAHKVYQAKQSINVARGALLPSLNIWKIIGGVLDPVSLITQDIAPFLVPANWFRLEQTKRLYLAEKEGYRALWANQVFNSKTLYLQVLSDQNLLLLIEEIRKNLTDLSRIAEKRERFGGLNPGIARELKIRELSLKEDILRLGRLVDEERRLLAFHLGFKWGTQISLAPVSLPDLVTTPKLMEKEFEWRVTSVSPERTQHLHFIDALKFIKDEVRYSFLGLASNSRGVAGGVFDFMPVSSGLGFAEAPNLKIAEAQRQRLMIQLMGIEETLKRDLSTVVSQMNIEIDVYPTLHKRSELSLESMDVLKKRLNFGGDLDPVLLGESFRGLVVSQSSLLQSQFRFLVFKERLMRLTFSGDYLLTPAVLEEIQGAVQFEQFN